MLQGVCVCFGFMPEKVEIRESMRLQEGKHGRRDERSDAERHCQQLACELQACAARHTYAPQKCEVLLNKYNKCKKDFLEVLATE